MRKRLLCQMGLGFLLGLLFLKISIFVFLPTAACLFLYFLWSIARPFLKRRRKILLAVTWILALILGLLRGMQQEMYEQSLAGIPAGQEVSFCGTLYKKEITSHQILYYLRDGFISYDGQVRSCRHVLFLPTSDEIPLGSVLTGEATVASFDVARNDGAYDASVYYATNDIYFSLEERTSSVHSYPKFFILESLNQFRTKLSDVFALYLPGEESGILSTMLLGDKSSLDKEAKDLFRLSGLSHMLVISGLHISILGMGLFRILRKCGVSYLSSALFSSSLLLLFLIMSGMGSSAIRACGMFFVLMGAQVLGKGYDSLTSLFLLLVAMLLFCPYEVTNTSVILSFASVFCVITFAKRLHEIFPYPGVTGLGITIGMLPLFAYFFYEVPLYGVLLNVLLLPFLSVLLILGILGGIAGLLGLPFTGVFFFVVHLILYVYEWAADFSLNLPFSRQIIGAPEVYLVVLYYVLLYLLLYHCRKKWVVPLALCGLILFFNLPKYRGFCMDFLDVGQGDGIYVQSEERVSFFIDGGSTTASSVGTYTILPFLKYHGVRKIDYWFISHPDLDHISGVVECLEAGYPVDTLVFSSHVVKNENFSELYDAALSDGCKILFLDRGDAIKTDSISFLCLYPWSDGEDPNAQSMVLKLETTDGMTALFGGDLGADEEELLASEVGDVTLFKAMHHGSNGSNTTELLEAMTPEAVVISCALKNSYGHPGEEAVSRLQAMCERLYYTMWQGQIHVTKKRQQLLITPKIYEEE